MDLFKKKKKKKKTYKGWYAIKSEQTNKQILPLSEALCHIQYIFLLVQLD